MPPELIAARQAERDFFREWMDANFRFELPEMIIEGGAKGADTCAFWWAKKNGIKIKTMKADWEKHGKSAGSIRNQAMLNERPDLVIAFPGGAGTADMVKKAKTRGVDVIEIKYES